MHKTNPTVNAWGSRRRSGPPRIGQDKIDALQVLASGGRPGAEEVREGGVERDLGGDRHRSAEPRLTLPILWTLCVLGAVATFHLAAVPEGLPSRYTVVLGLCWGSAVFAVGALARTALRPTGREREFFALLCAGLLAGGLAGQLGSLVPEGAEAVHGAWVEDAAYGISCLLSIGALLALGRQGLSRKMIPLVALDLSAILLASGALAWRLFLGSESGPGTWYALQTEQILLRVACYAGLLVLVLVTLHGGGRPPGSMLLAGSFAAFLLAEGSYLSASPEGGYGVGEWHGLFFAAGSVLLGTSASKLARSPDPMPGGTADRKVLWFWLAALSPAVQGVFLLSWATLDPAPGMVHPLWIGAALLLYTVLRTVVVYRVNEHFRREGDQAVKRREQDRILRELHDTAKQNMHGVALLLQSCLDSDDVGNRDGVRGRLQHALGLSQEADLQLSKPMEELGALQDGLGEAPTAFFKERLRQFGDRFGVDTREDLRASLEILDRSQVAAVYRIFVETTWNVAKHSGATSFWLESRCEGSVFSLKLWDDGRGFCPEVAAAGMGLRLMRARAHEAGARLDVFSRPGWGTCVEVRLEQSKKEASVRA